MSGAHLSDALEARYQRLVRRQAAVAQLGMAALQGSETHTLIRNALALVSEEIDAPLCAVLELTPDKENLVIRDALGWQNAVGTSVPAGRGSQGGFALMTGEPVIIEDMERETRFKIPRVMTEHGVGSGLSVIMTGPQGPFGVMGVHARVPRVFDEDDVHFVQSVSNVVATAAHRERCEAAIHVSQYNYRQLMEQAADAVIITDAEGRILETNGRAGELLGYSHDELLSKNLGDLGRDPNGHRPWSVLQAGETLLLEQGFKRRDGGGVDVEVSIKRLEDGRLLGIARDITERKVAARVLREREIQLFQLQKMEAVALLAGGVAHDFNNLLTVILGYTDSLLKRTLEDDPARGELERTRAAGEKAASLVRQLLAFSSQQVLAPRVLDLAVLVGGLREMLERLLGATIDLSIESDAPLWRVKADPAQIEQALVNLVANARDAMPQGGSLSIRTTNVPAERLPARVRAVGVGGACVALSIMDSGCGIPPEDQERIFEPFFTTKPVGKGTGLGLAGVYGVVQQSQGAMTVESEPGRGAEFSIFLPVTDEPALDQASEGVLEPLRGGAETVLVVEDEEVVRVLEKSVLEHRGYRVLVAAGPDEALRLAGQRERTIDLVITDVVMPGLYGPDLVDRIREARPGLKVLFVSGYAQEALPYHRLSERGVAFLQKPFHPEAFLRQVREVLDQGR